MAQPKPSTTEMSMPTFETLEEWTRSQIQSLDATRQGLVRRNRRR